MRDVKLLLAEAEAAKPLSTVHKCSMLDYILSSGFVERAGTWCEFGVYKGTTLQQISEHMSSETELWGFDSFRGLPENWNDEHPQGCFALSSIPKPPKGVRLCVGLFSETLPSWHPQKQITFAYVDCDLYSSAEDVFAILFEECAPGAVIVIDDFFTEPHEKGVARALAESMINFEILCRRGCGENESIAIRVK